MSRSRSSDRFIHQVGHGRIKCEVIMIDTSDSEAMRWIGPFVRSLAVSASHPLNRVNDLSSLNDWMLYPTKKPKRILSCDLRLNS